MKIFLILSVLMLLGCTLFWFATNSRASTETTAYRVVKKTGDVEIRDYPEMEVARTPMDSRGMDGSFGRLFRFITGANDSKKNIAMTTPVLIAGSDNERTMSFILPVATVRDGVPAPNGSAVKIEKLSAARYAAMRFSGGRNEANEKRAGDKIRALLKNQNITPVGEVVFAYYDPPWTPLFMRRNEVLIRVEKTAVR